MWRLHWHGWQGAYRWQVTKTALIKPATIKPALITSVLIKSVLIKSVLIKSVLIKSARAVMAPPVLVCPVSGRRGWVGVRRAVPSCSAAPRDWWSSLGAPLPGTS
jgi:hypothetical protein